MSKCRLAFSFGILAMVGTALAQTPEAPKPGPEHKVMDFFAGSWLTEGEMKPGPFGPGGKVTSRDVCQWFEGGFQLVCKGRGTGPMGPMISMGVLAYKAADRTYTYYGIDNAGLSELSIGRRSGKTWTFTSTANMAGQSFKSRYTMVETSPVSYTYVWETSTDGTNWSTMLEGKAEKPIS